MTVSAVIPIKQLVNAKQRLAGFLGGEERTALCRAMASDVLTAVESCSHVDEIVVVTGDV